VAAQETATAGTLLFECAEHLSEVARIVTSLGHDLSTENIGFSFILTTELQQVHCEWRLRKLADTRSTQDRSCNSSNTSK
jgi:hypothetical protein